MIDTFTDAGTYLDKKRERAARKKRKKNKKWGAFHFFLLASGLMIAAMWGFIFFGGQEAPSGAGNFLQEGKPGRIFLFLVDNGLKRYAHYNKMTYPEQLSHLVPDYVKIKEDQVGYLSQLLYIRDPSPDIGYRLSFVVPPEDGMNVELSAQGLSYTEPGSGGS